MCVPASGLTQTIPPHQPANSAAFLAFLSAQSDSQGFLNLAASQYSLQSRRASSFVSDSLVTCAVESGRGAYVRL